MQARQGKAEGQASVLAHGGVLAGPRAHAVARAHLPTTPLVMSFMGPSLAVTNFVKKLVEQDRRKGAGGALPPIIVDHHYYLNWQLPDGCFAWDGSCQMTWAQVR